VVKIVHEHNGRRIEREGTGMLLVTDETGSFFTCTPDKSLTKYNGLAHNEHGKLFKTVERLILEGKKVTELSHRIDRDEQRWEDALLSFYLEDGTLSCRIENFTGKLTLDLDMRFLDQMEGNGRVYTIKQAGDALLITYEQFSDDNRNGKRYERVLAIKGLPDTFTPLQQWQERWYEYDDWRHDAAHFWIFRAGTINVTSNCTLTFACGPTAEQALERATYLYKQDELKRVRRAAAAKQLYDDTLERSLCLFSLNSLVRKDEDGMTAIQAGLPWFSQPWSRDELVSVGAFITARRYDLAKRILLRYTALLPGKTTLDAYYPKGGLASADAMGWLAKRLHQLLVKLEKERKLFDLFPRKELLVLKEKFHAVAEQLLGQRNVSGLLENKDRETWMDTEWNGDVRSGARIEIQAGMLALLSLCKYLDKKTRKLPSLTWNRREHEFSHRVKEAFFQDGKLADGVVNNERDMTLRPNIFLAHYLYPELLSAKEWSVVFDHALPGLWLPWGGFSTIDKAHALFTSKYTGMSNQSYHRGDSWYWVNCLAAISMHRVDAARYARWVEGVLDAAKADMLAQGAIGHCSELSSAEKQQWGGCFSQAWSAAFLYELLNE